LPKNIGELDRTIRLVVATLLIIISFFVASVPLQLLLTLIALILLATSWSRTCLVYIPLKIDTRKQA
jgi:hypothetical protein